MTNDKNKGQIYPSTLQQNYYVTKIYFCISTQNRDEEGYYIRLNVPRDLLMNDNNNNNDKDENDDNDEKDDKDDKMKE